MTLFRLDASIRIDGSVTRQVADTVERSWAVHHPGVDVVRRDVGTSPLPSQAWPLAVAGAWIPADQRNPEQGSAAELASTLADELVAAQAYVFAVPLYNFGVAQGFKTWVDLVVTDPRFGPGAPSAVTGRPAVLVTARGGGYGAGTPREGWDHSTPYLKRILGDVFGLDLHVVEAELTLAGVTPAMEALRPLADESLRDALAVAAEHGLTLAERIRAAA